MCFVFSVFVFFISFVLLFVFFFFKQKTAYEMRISDWSSDVCSSDLVLRKGDRLEAVARHVTLQPAERRIEAGREAVKGLGPRLVRAAARHWREQEARTRAAGGLLESYSFRPVLERGYVVVRDSSGVPVPARAGAQPDRTSVG